MKVVIIGGGFAGLQLARKLNNKKGIEVLLIDKNNYHQFQPLFYQVATAGLDASNISFPLRKVFHKSHNVRFRMATVKEVKQAENKLVTDIGEFEYDVLVMAMGANTNFFGNTNLQELAFPMKSTTEALQLRHHLIQKFEDALMIKDQAEMEKMLNIIVVGGGPTGVEISGAVAEMRNNILPRDYPELDFSKMKIFLLEGSPKTLGVMSAKSSTDSRGYLENKLGVIVRTGTIVKDYDGEEVTLSTGEKIPAKTVIWAAGVKGNVPAGVDPALIVRGNRIKVNRQSRMEGSSNIYVIGDLSYMETPKYDHGHPQLANVAINQGKTLAKNLIRINSGQTSELIDFEYKDKGSMATVGRNLAVVDIPVPKLHVKGFLAWLIWMFLHLVLILGVKNRMQIFINWMYKYFTYDQSLRLLFKEFYKPRVVEHSSVRETPAATH
ncbi:NAD(P)/FAD-dependent oxidoreductase [Deminuibacter soli]|uniref:NADH:ubiquinone reductase (non-electrogenic) n=1 Tax=Deminuibacter soli TaxID=2291815 RepID=A0A3E1NJI1_9BACT|nr:NAD(P)/FAD-dependent oxidoreductase [Deminuibacter soli]RFM28097.1 NAD(P)/FAD-dependent oxidoreductase [Deminuibacter soli]